MLLSRPAHPGPEERTEVLKLLEKWKRQRSDETFDAAYKEILDRLQEAFLARRLPGLAERALAAFLLRESPPKWEARAASTPGPLPPADEESRPAVSRVAGAPAPSVSVFMKNLGLQGLSGAEQLAKLCESCFTEPVARARVVNMLCAMHSSTMPALGTEHSLRADLAFFGSRILYDLIYDWARGMGGAERQHREGIDSFARAYCQMLNAAPLFAQHSECVVIPYAAQADSRRMDHSADGPVSRTAIGGRPLVRPRSCYVTRRSNLDQPYRKAEVDLI